MASIRKHYTQLTENEHSFLMNKLTNVKKWLVSSHLKERIEERGGDYESILNVMNAGSIIEYHQKDGESRVLMRGTRVFFKHVLCVVYQLHDGKVITIFWNAEKDNHRTLKQELYNEDLDVIALFNEEQKKRDLK